MRPAQRPRTTFPLSRPPRTSPRRWTVTESNAAVFDPENSFRGCISGILHCLARVGLIEAVRTLGEHERLSPGQTDRIDRIIAAYPHLADDEFVKANLDRWLAP